MGQWRKTGTDTQRYTRILTSVQVRVSTVDAERDPDTGKLFFRSTENTTANLSRGGAFVHSWEPLTEGRRVVVAMDLPSGEEFQVVARVAWTRREVRQADSNELQAPGYGLEFIGGSSAEIAALDTLIAAMQTSQDPTSAPASTAPPSSLR